MTDKFDDVMRLANRVANWDDRLEITDHWHDIAVQLARGFVAFGQLTRSTVHSGDSAEQIAATLLRAMAKGCALELCEGPPCPCSSAIAQALTNHAAASEARVRELEAALRQMVEAIEKKAVSIDSACIGGGHPEIGYEQHYWHEEWLHYARRALGGKQ